MKPYKFVVIGGGITGLSAAHAALSQGFVKPEELKLLEASSRLGGSFQTLRQDGFLLETGPDCFLSEKPAGIDLCRSLGLEEELLGIDARFRRSFVARGNSLPRALRRVDRPSLLGGSAAGWQTLSARWNQGVVLSDLLWRQCSPKPVRLSVEH